MIEAWHMYIQAFHFLHMYVFFIVDAVCLCLEYIVCIGIISKDLGIDGIIDISHREHI